MSRKTKRRSRRLQSLGSLSEGLGEAATVGRIYLGRNVNLGPGHAKSAELDDQFVTRAAEAVAAATTGGVTVTNANGIYTGRSEDGSRWSTQERTTVFTAIVPERDGGSCRQVVRRLRAAAHHLARRGHQDSVLVEVRCANGRENAALVTKRGRTEPLYPLTFQAPKRLLK